MSKTMRSVPVKFGIGAPHKILLNKFDFLCVPLSYDT